MPQMANITVKNVANADVVYAANVPSAGDKSPAVWTQTAAHATPAFRPKFTVLTRDNARRNGRVLEVSFSFPVIATVNGVDVLVATVPLRLSGTLPTNVSANAVQEAFHQMGNLLVSTLIRSVATEGYAPS